MLNEPQNLKWYQLSIRDKFMLAGMFAGLLIYQFGGQRLHPAPWFFWLITPVFMLIGAGIGEIVKRRRARGA